MLVLSFLIDIVAMVLAMPRALFPEVAETRFGGGAAIGWLYSAIAIGSVLGGVTSGWIGRVRRQGVALVAAVVGWGLAVALAGRRRGGDDGRLVGGAVPAQGRRQLCPRDPPHQAVGDGWHHHGGAARRPLGGGRRRRDAGRLGSATVARRGAGAGTRHGTEQHARAATDVDHHGPRLEPDRRAGSGRRSGVERRLEIGLVGHRAADHGQRDVVRRLDRGVGASADGGREREEKEKKRLEHGGLR